MKIIKTNFSIEMDTTKRKKTISKIHELEKEMFSLVVHFYSIRKNIISECTKALEKNTNAAFNKVAKYQAYTPGQFDNKKNNEHDINKIKFTLNKIIKTNTLYENNNDPITQEALLTSLSTLFKETNWVSKIRNNIQSQYSQINLIWSPLRKKINRLLKNANKTNRVNKFEYKTFLANLNVYPLEKNIKESIIKDIQQDLNKINLVLESDILKNIKHFFIFISTYNELIKLRQETMLSVTKYLSSVTRKNNISDAEDINEIINESVINIMSSLHTFKVEMSFINFVHTYCQSAIYQFKLNKKKIRAPLQLEQRKKAIFSAYHQSNNLEKYKTTNIENITKIYNQSNPNFYLSESDILTFLNSETTTSIEGHVDESIYNKLDSNNTPLYGESSFNISPEKATEINKKHEKILAAIKKLNNIDQTILNLKFEKQSKEYSIQEIANICNLSYDQCRRHIKKCNDFLKSFVE